MPSAISMDHGGQNGVHTDHDRSNGANGGFQDGLDKAKAAAAAAMNGQGNADAHSHKENSQLTIGQPSRMNDLPDEIVHITQGFIPLSLLLTRLSQHTHNALQDKIVELAKMSVPSAAMNGNSGHATNPSDDTSSENLRKKTTLLNFAQEWHAKWVKALVIIEWSRNAGLVSKLIDLKFHLDQQRILYDAALDNVVNMKRDLTYARMPSPDLKTALQVLSTGSAPWLPDHQYIPLPPLKPEEQLKWVNDLDTLLSLRLNLDDFDKIPHQFRQYEIGSGRVTFKVPGEFELDLTIADEDFEKQFWFIDLRLAFRPAAQSLPDSLRSYLEGFVNGALSKDGLTGAYQFLHEFVLTMKINELKRQANQLSKSSWTGTLNVEPLNRALAIQYWTSRSNITGTKSWVLVAINSGRKPSGQLDPKASSCLVAKWYRDGKEVKDVDIPLDADNISAENLIKAVVGRHIEYILTSIRNKLLLAPRFKNHEAGVALHISETDPAASSLSTQIGYRNTTSLLMEPATGSFAVKPHSKFTSYFEHRLNTGKSPTEDGVLCLEQIRCGVLEEELNRRGNCMGWQAKREKPMKDDELRTVIRHRDRSSRVVWLQKTGWGAQWFVAVVLSLGGDEWWLLEVQNGGRTVQFQTKIPLHKGHPDLTDGFWNNLTLFTSGMIVQSVDLRELHSRKIKSRYNDSANWSLPRQVRLPTLEVALSAIFPAMQFETSAPKPALPEGAAEIAAIIRPNERLYFTPRQPWAVDMVRIRFKGIQSRVIHDKNGGPSTTQLICVSESVIKVKQPSKFNALGGVIDRDVSYSAKRGEFCLRLRHPVGESAIGALQSKIKAVDRFVDFLAAMDKAKGPIGNGKMTLQEVSFEYDDQLAWQKTEGAGEQWRVVLNLSKDDIDLEVQQGNPHLRVLDLMKRLVNAEGGIGALLNWLPTSLPALRAIDEIQSAWQETQAQNRGRIEFTIKTVDWIGIHYTLGPLEDPTRRQLLLEVQLRMRRDGPWWHMCRTGAANATSDDFSKILQPIWDGKGDNWIGLVNSAAGKPGNGIVGLLRAVDEGVRGLLVAAPGTSGDAPVVLD
ncbi:mediator of RNA polymerase II transcription subunit 14 [Stachybotrys elegans]|uniref:Mediator of RNA polymerase II transcription subunit 14 n=1 Tax=Stachybotrys elegans TaxID=80388 RepID=A0A8K0WVX5_9HYPO|nr:mediator of RNA polymerase II transcription subunit 14 [Stachybotrys elegans]